MAGFTFGRVAAAERAARPHAPRRDPRICPNCGRDGMRCAGGRCRYCGYSHRTGGAPPVGDAVVTGRCSGAGAWGGDTAEQATQ